VDFNTCNFDTFQIGFHAEHLFSQSMGKFALHFENKRAITRTIKQNPGFFALE